jgi:hypothetical protein
VSTITEIHEKHRRDTAAAQIDCHLDALEMLRILLDQQVSFCFRAAIPLHDSIPGRQLRTAHAIIDSIRGSMDRMDKLFADPAVAEPVLKMAAE